MKVLAADDDEPLRDIISRLLSRLGVESLVASSGEEAFSAFREALGRPGARFDAAFVDLGMPWLPGGSPDEGGFELARAIRAEEERSGTGRSLLIALTGADRRGASASADPCFDLFLQKPVGMDELRKALGMAPGLPRPRQGRT